MSIGKKVLYTVCCGLFLTSFSVNASEENIKYKIPEDVDCKKTAENLTFCVSKKGDPVTGEMLKYKNGVVSRRYAMKDGYLDGIGKSYDEHGYLISELPYKQGRLNGNVIVYNRQGKIVSKTPYINGIKEGIATYQSSGSTVKVIYINDQLNGDIRITDDKTKEIIYELSALNNQIISGLYYHYDSEDIRCCEKCPKEELLQKESIPDLIITGLNNKCLELQKNISCTNCPVKASGSNPECDQEWHKKNRKTVIDYMKNCSAQN